MKKLLAAVLLALTFCTAAQANPTYSFVCITNNNAGNAAIGEAQLFVDVSAITNQVLFTFRNIGPQPCFIRGVYFDDGTLLALADLIDKDQNGGDPNVDFSQGASPPDLPGRNNISPPFNTTAGFLAAADSPGTNKDGVDPYESLGVIFNLKTGKTYNDVIGDLASGDLRIGLKVQGFANGGSESFVNNGHNSCSRGYFARQHWRGLCRLAKKTCDTITANRTCRSKSLSANGCERFCFCGYEERES